MDVHEGLENTLVILRSKLRKGIRVIKDYAPNLPMIDAYGELNQVWTNLIDNAADAVQESGGGSRCALARQGGVLVEVEDNGAGIPQRHRRLFSRFHDKAAWPRDRPGAGYQLQHRDAEAGRDHV